MVRRLSRQTFAASALALAALVCAGEPASAALSVSAPGNANLGSASVSSSSTSAQLGTVTVNASGLVAPSFVATVATTVFTTGGRTANETIAESNISYWSGPATSTSGTFLSLTPGQPDAGLAQTLAVPRTAFSATALTLSVAVSWNPTLVVNIPPGAVAGTYTGTIIHSVA